MSDASATQLPAGPLARLDHATRLLAEARTVDEVKLIRDQAEAMRIYARERDLGLEAQNHAAEIKIRAERRMGDILTEMPKHPAGRPSENRYPPDTDLPPRLSDLGITRVESSRFQQMAAIPEPVFEQHVAEAKAAERELTTAAVVRLASDEQRKRDRDLSDKVLATARGSSPEAEAKQRTLHLQSSFAKALAKAQDLVCLKPDALASALQPGDVEDGRRFIRRFDSWADAFEAATAQPVRILGNQPETEAG